ncbi:MAG: ABC transporter ATP-binding protein [Lachnospiraceae bacterium]|nr:ABC transporter ATP-binding protein [Lachnospiraceae bacterium]
MNTELVINGTNIKKTFKNFELNIPELKIPKGFATALVGENGAGKTTLINILTGVKLDYKGSIRYFDKYTDADRETKPELKNAIGYTGTSQYFFPQWTAANIEEINTILFDSFSSEKFRAMCDELAIFPEGGFKGKVKVSEMSDGMKTKIALAGVWARDTQLLILDEPASPLDPLMRDKLNRMISEYIESGNGERSVFTSTHNIADMEAVTDYVIIMERGAIVEEGFVEDLKEKYVLVKGENTDADKAAPAMYTFNKSQHGWDGICLAENVDKLAGLDIVTETPSLSQICVAVMKQNSRLK